MNSSIFEAAMGVYSAFKLFHFPDKIATLPRDKSISPPTHIRWKPTNQCNHRCHYCAYREKDLQLGKDMQERDSTPREKMLETANDLVSMGVKAVTFSGGGEPFLYPHLLDACRILAAGNVKFAALTNGALLSGETAAFFARHAVWVRVSMDGWDDVSYARYRGVKGKEYTRILNNMENFSANEGACVLGVSLIIDAVNAPHLRAMMHRLKNAGVSGVKVSACIVSNDAAENNAYHAPHFNFVHDAIREAKAELGDTSFEIMDAWHTLDERFHKAYDWCPFSQMLAVIGADLGIYPCQDKAYNNDALLGSLREQSFKDFWMQGKEAFFRIQPFQDCIHHCVANAKNTMLHEFLNTNKEHLEFI